MKKIAIVTLLSASLATHAFADNVNVPFINKLVPAEGLTINYDTNGTEKIVCITDNFYKGYLTLTENGVEKDAGISFGNYDGDQFYFSSNEKDNTNAKVSRFHVDKIGHIKIKDTNFNPHQSHASCFYIPETQTI